MRLSNTLFAAPIDPASPPSATRESPNTLDIHLHRKPPKVNVIGIMVIVCNIKTCLKPITAFVCEPSRSADECRAHYRGDCDVVRACLGRRREEISIIP